jgi:hypothetical protein
LESVVIDSTLHAGVLVSEAPESRADVVPYAGISSQHQQTVTESQTGTFTVTGRVVAGSEIDPSLEGEHGVIVYNMDRQGNLALSRSGQNQAETYAEDVEESQRDQMNTTQQNWDSESRDGDASATDRNDGDESTTTASESESGVESDYDQSGGQRYQTDDFSFADLRPLFTGVGIMTSILGFVILLVTTILNIIRTVKMRRHPDSVNTSQKPFNVAAASGLICFGLGILMVGGWIIKFSYLVAAASGVGLLAFAGKVVYRAL